LAKEDIFIERSCNVEFYTSSCVVVVVVASKLVIASLPFHLGEELLIGSRDAMPYVVDISITITEF